MADKEKLRKELNKLVLEGRLLFYYFAIKENILDEKSKATLVDSEIYKCFLDEVKDSNAQSVYQNWYSKSMKVVKQLLPDRFQEFKNLYYHEKRSSKDVSLATYSIYDYMMGLKLAKYDESRSVSIFASKMDIQLGILNSCLDIIDFKLSDITGILRYDIYENELETAKDMLKKKHYRLAGALAGIVLEGHLKQTCSNRKLKTKKSNPTISEYNEILKENEIIDLPTWRLIQRLGDIRNMSVHAKERDPKPDEVEDLIRGCEKLIAELN